MPLLRYHHWLEGNRAKLIDGAARTESEEFTMVFGGEGARGVVDGIYPYLLTDARPCDEKGAVIGELYEVSEETLAQLDKLEEHPIEYCRRQVQVRNHKTPAWLYVYEEKDTLAEINLDLTCNTYVAVPKLDWRSFRQQQRYHKRSLSLSVKSFLLLHRKTVTSLTVAGISLAYISASPLSFFCSS
mmetsp:Transcript_1880/g.2854  ORF Transcript_1880/g.2854 Transcript_1880/m.2854 type:complete len:186 (-) Transcript_1880:95-652(-)